MALGASENDQISASECGRESTEHQHTRQVIIEGFKSYKDQTATDAFSPGINVVGEQDNGKRRNDAASCRLLPYCRPARVPLPVGANGSGKSNFFSGACTERRTKEQCSIGGH